MGPRLSAGKNVNAPTIMTVHTSKIVKSGPVTGKVPTDSGVIFFLARFPAMARIGITMKKRPKSITSAVLVLYQSVLAFRPANAEPLFPADDV